MLPFLVRIVLSHRGDGETYLTSNVKIITQKAGVQNYSMSTVEAQPDWGPNYPRNNGKDRSDKQLRMQAAQIEQMRATRADRKRKRGNWIPNGLGTQGLCSRTHLGKGHKRLVKREANC
ncbi:hypothetical protein Tco_1482158 [Tanacetum coccineum]